jgi:ABC-2 type transport system ATP-binding protein
MMIETKGLRKAYRTGRGRKSELVDAVVGLDLQVAEGEIFGFLGPNGAGKTTTLRMLATLIPPDGGEAVIAGADLRTEPAAVRRAIGYIAQGGGTWDDVTAREELILQARMHGVLMAEARTRAAAAVEAFHLAEYADRNCKTYSGGQRRRVDIALGVVHRPKVVFLDEPTASLDPAATRAVEQIIDAFHAAGTKIVMTTHDLGQARRLADEVVFLHQGRIAERGEAARFFELPSSPAARAFLTGDLLW